jgi:acyl-CoA thioesterase-2
MTEGADLYDMVAVTGVPGGRGAEALPGFDVYRGRPVVGPYGRVFGGQLVGQAVMAASATIGESRPAHSLHASFLRMGDSGQPIDYEVSTVRDGRTISVRTVSAHQHGRELLTATLSFQAPQGGLAHEVAVAIGYPDPDSLEPGALETLAHRAVVEIRRVPDRLDPKGPDNRAGQAVWLRAVTPRAHVSPAVGRAVLAMATDFTVLESAVKALGLTLASEGLTVASLDHSIWWHAPAALDDWVLYVQESPWSGGHRALILGRIYARDGRLLASIAQEGLLRLDSALDVPS